MICLLLQYVFTYFFLSGNGIQFQFIIFCGKYVHIKGVISLKPVRPTKIWFCKTKEPHCRFTLLFDDLATVTTWFVTLVPVSMILDTLSAEYPVTDTFYHVFLVIGTLVSDILVTVVPVYDF